MKMIIIQVLPHHAKKAITVMAANIEEDPISHVPSCPSKGIEHDTVIYSYNQPIATHFIYEEIVDAIGEQAESNAVHVTITPKATS